MPSQDRRNQRPNRVRQLEQGFTTVMLRCLPPDVTVQSVLTLLDEVASCRYDFVYVPHDRHTQANIGLAWVNFVDHETSARAFQELQSRTGSGCLSGALVRSANIQGLAANLAYLQARFGLQALRQAMPPLVFQDGRLRNLGKVVKALVTPRLLQEAREVVAAERDGTSMKSCRGGYARRRQRYVWNPVSSREATDTSGLVRSTASLQVLDDSAQATIVLTSGTIHSEAGHPPCIERVIFSL